jgi:hypothetical protein
MTNTNKRSIVVLAFLLLLVAVGAYVSYGTPVLNPGVEHGSKIYGPGGSSGVLMDTTQRQDHHSRVCDQWANGANAGQKVERYNPYRYAWTYDRNGTDPGCGNEYLGFSGTRHKVTEDGGGAFPVFGKVSDDH